MLLDIIMVVVILTLFDKNFISMRYHEIAGLLYTSFSQTEGVSKGNSEKRNGMREGRMNGKSHKEFKKEGSGKERQNGDNAKLVFVTKDGLQSFLMFFDMIFSVAVITYWIVYEKKRRIHRPLLVGNTISEELKRISTQEQK